MVSRSRDPAPVELRISAETVSFIIVKAREYDAKVDPSETDPGSDPADDGQAAVLEDFADDATRQELVASIRRLNTDEVADLVALVWVGRGDFDRGDFDEARRLAAERMKRDSSSYLVGMPLLADYLEEGLAETGHRFDPALESHL